MPPPVAVIEPPKATATSPHTIEPTPVVANIAAAHAVAPQVPSETASGAVIAPETPPIVAKSGEKTPAASTTDSTNRARVSTPQLEKKPIAPVAAPIATRQVTSKPNVSVTASKSIGAKPTAIRAAANANEARPKVVEAQAPQLRAPTTVAAIEATLNDLWVVSYGEDDDRELTTPQIAAELAAGKITALTIVWRESMPEWLPISGVTELAQYLQAPKVAPKARPNTSPIRPSATSATKKSEPTINRGEVARSPSQPKAAPRSTLSSTPKVSATVISPVATRERQRSSEDLKPEALGQDNSQVSGTAKNPPPLVRQTQKSAPTLDPKRAEEPQKAVVDSLEDSRTPDSKPQEPVELEASVPWRRAQESLNEVLTSAPSIDQVSAPEHSKPELPPEPLPSATEGATLEEPQAPAPAQAQQSAAKPVSPAQNARGSSFRPPKPLETATSLVVHTEGSTSAEVLSITDEEFLQMQRRFPKWALPLVTVVGLGIAGFVAHLVMSTEAPPPLPVAPIPLPATSSTSDRAKQPDLGAVPGPPSSVLSGGGQDFAKAFAQAANKGIAAFDAKGAERAASPAVERASRCRVGAEPMGQVTAVVVIAPAGQVTSVQVGAPHTTTVTGKCIEKAMHGFATKPFQGGPEKLSLTITLR
jgi:hypothetical protein